MGISRQNVIYFTMEHETDVEKLVAMIVEDVKAANDENFWFEYPEEVSVYQYLKDHTPCEMYEIAQKVGPYIRDAAFGFPEGLDYSDRVDEFVNAVAYRRLKSIVLTRLEEEAEAKADA